MKNTHILAQLELPMRFLTNDSTEYSSSTWQFFCSSVNTPMSISFTFYSAAQLGDGASFRLRASANLAVRGRVFVHVCVLHFYPSTSHIQGCDRSARILRCLFTSWRSFYPTAFSTPSVRPHYFRSIHTDAHSGLQQRIMCFRHPTYHTKYQTF